MPMSRVEILRAACCVAGLDEHISDEEATMLQQIADYAGVGKASLDAMMDCAKTDPNYYDKQFRLVTADAETTMRVLFSVACADHDLTTDERIVLHHFAQVLGMDDARFNKILAAAQRKVDRGRQGGG